MGNDNKRSRDQEKNPMITLSDSVNHSTTGDLGALAKGGCLTRIIVLAIIVIGLIIFYFYSK